MTFEELGLNDELLEGLDVMGFQTATPVQEKAIPLIFEGKDLIACAQTGTGKTAAFLLPVLHKLTQSESNTIDTLILVPTRELAVQIDQQLEGFAYFTPVNSLAIYGGRDGASFEREKKALTSGVNVVVATPGRLIAHLNMGYVKLSELQWLILDEADRMLDMGFVRDLEKIISFLPKERQTLMFSATMPPQIRKFAKTVLNEPEQISFAVSKPAEGILQGAYEVEDEVKLQLLQQLFQNRKNKEERVIIFASTKLKVGEIAAGLKGVGLNCGHISSNLDQTEREQILRQFKNGSLPILVATDILSRGIDVKGINLVVNYDVPSDGEDYIHRIGRTARADATGVALTLINRRDRRKFKDIERLMETEVRRMPLTPDLKAQNDKAAAKGGSGGRGRGGGRSRGRTGGGGRGRGRGGSRGTSKRR